MKDLILIHKRENIYKKPVYCIAEDTLVNKNILLFQGKDYLLDYAYDKMHYSNVLFNLKGKGIAEFAIQAFSHKPFVRKYSEVCVSQKRLKAYQNLLKIREYSFLKRYLQQ